MKFGRYPQWITAIKDDECQEIGIEDVAYINEDKSHAHAYIDWDSNRDKKFFFKKSQISWQVLDESKDAVLVLSKYNIECKQFHDKDEPVVWEKSSLRKWLNEEFYNQAFNETEKAYILEKEIENEINPVSFIKSGGATKDKIFLLSFRDVFNVKYGFDGYIQQSKTREAKNTDWTRVMGALTNPEKGMGWWWLRNSGENSNSAGRIDYSGYIYFQGRPITEFGSVRPAMYLKKTALGVSDKAEIQKIR